MGDKKIINRIINSLLFDLKHIDIDIVNIYFIYLKNIALLKFHRGSWDCDLSSEDFFWRRHFHELYIKYPNIPPYSNVPIKSKRSIQLALGYIENQFKPPYRCVDVGCGPTSQFFTEDLKKRNDLEILTVDPLAETYNHLHNKYRTRYDLKCLTGYGERLTELFPEGYFHIVYSQNAIDHSQSPEDFLKKLYLILIKGGYLVLYGFIKEGTAARWLGLHQWDIEVEEGHLLLTSRDGTINKKNMTNAINMETVYEEVTGPNIGDTYTLIYKKR
jgi:SAM-dependent methyltransferase